MVIVHSTPPVPSLHVHADLPVHRVPTRTGERLLTVDLWLPALPPVPCPLVIYIHGGAWRHGTPWRPPVQPRLFADNIALAAITYRFTGEAPFPAMLHDCRLAVRWLRAHAERYQLDPARFGVWGISAGGHLAALLGTPTPADDTAAPPDPWREHSATVQAVCSWCGPTDLVGTFTDANPGREMRTLAAEVIGGPFATHEAVARAVSPLHRLDLTPPADLPPFLLVHGQADDVVPPWHATRFHAALRARAAVADLQLMPGLGHNLDHPATTARVREFFLRHLAPASCA
jgi:acetyl esterase/lipase